MNLLIMPVRHALYYIVRSHDLDKEPAIYLDSTDIFEIRKTFMKTLYIFRSIRQVLWVFIKARTGD